MSTFVMGDIHGGYKALLQCLQRSGFRYKQDTLIQLGDIADGFDEVFECVEELLKIKHMIAIRGNHDDWFLEFIQTGRHPQRWAQGGEGTLRSYCQAMGKEAVMPYIGLIDPAVLKPAEIPATHRRFFELQRLYYTDTNNNCFVHAGFNRHRPIEEQEELTYFWDRLLWRQALSYEAFDRYNKMGLFRMATPFREVYIGHTRTTMWETDQPMKAANIFNIDTGAGGGGRLTIMNVFTKEYWQSDPVNELYSISYR